jgi:hypothetical protein
MYLLEFSFEGVCEVSLIFVRPRVIVYAIFEKPLQSVVVDILGFPLGVRRGLPPTVRAEQGKPVKQAPLSCAQISFPLDVPRIATTKQVRYAHVINPTSIQVIYYLTLWSIGRRCLMSRVKIYHLLSSFRVSPFPAWKIDSYHGNSIFRQGSFSLIRAGGFSGVDFRICRGGRGKRRRPNCMKV